MVMVFEGTPDEYSMDGYLKSNLDIARNIITKDWDMLFLYDGGERSGKSVKAMQDAYYCDQTLNLNRITFNAKEFRQAIINSKPYQAVIYDEAYTGLSSRATMSLINRTLVGMMAEIGQKNLFVFVVMPTFFDLDKYVALWRSRALIHIYTGDNFQRGFFAFYNADKKKELYINGKKFYNYSYPRPNFTGRFVNHYVIDEAAYKKKKHDSLMLREKTAEEAEIRKEVDALLFERCMELKEKHENNISHPILMKILDMPSATYFRKLKNWKEGGET